MMSSRSTIRMPEWLVFVRAILLGGVIAEVGRIGFLSSLAWGRQLADDGLIGFAIAGGTFVTAGLIAYAIQREAPQHARRIVASRRFDLAALLIAGAWIDQLLEPQLAKFHIAVSSLDKGWAQAALTTAFIIMMSPVFRPIFGRKRQDLTQLRFVSDVEISDAGQDALSVTKQVADFAQTVLTSGTQSGMVFGLDGPWGIGKTSFLNLAVKHWDEVAGHEVIIFKFEPLRYASEPDLVERFIRDLCAKIQQTVFAPEFSPVASRYSKMLKGKTDVSILGVKLTLEPSTETIDELLNDIDNVLEQIDRRLIIVIDDLDRLEPKLVNNVLFTVRRTFRLNRATYILCYDTEQLVAGKEEGSRARDFLEKFITAKLSLFVELQAIRNFLDTDWHADGARFQTIPSDVMFELRQITSTVGSLISGPKAYNYTPLLGDLRKVKRFVNALLLLNLEKTDLGRSDFHHEDLIHLVLLHLCYPGLFRRIYGEETEGRTGSFAVQRGEGGVGKSSLVNGGGLNEIVAKAEPAAQFLLKQLFDVQTIQLGSLNWSDVEVLRTRACFNAESRNLENYLQLIVRLKVPEPTTTFRMFKDLLDEVLTGKATVRDVLERPAFASNECEAVHDQFWRVLVNNAHQMDRAAADNAITSLVTWLPRYSMLDLNDRSLRHRSIYSLVLLLDRAGFGEPHNDRVRSSSDVVEIADRILGSPSATSALIYQLTEPSRGPLGWNDLMLLRLNCCADRLGQVHNIYTALLKYEDRNARTEGDVAALALNSMRRFSQQVFQEFKARYIIPGVSFFTDVDGIGDHAILANFKSTSGDHDGANPFEVARSTIKSFVIYQLVNQRRADGSGVGCGAYDETGHGDRSGIHRAMCDYLFGTCFNPSLGIDHARAFGDFCLRSFREGILFGDLATLDPSGAQSALTQLLGREEMKTFWATSGEQIKSMLKHERRTVVSRQYSATYAERLQLTFTALDQLLVTYD